MAQGAISGNEVIRRCAVMRELRHEHELLRFVADPEGVICFDLKRKLDGRGVWITASRSVLAEAIKRKAFQRSLRRRVHVPEDLVDQVENALLRAALGYLSLANKAGQVAIGFAKVTQAVEKARAAALVHADEAARDGCHRLDRKFFAIARGHGTGGGHVFRFPVSALSQALGRENVNHAAALRGGAGLSFVVAAERLSHFTGDGITKAGGSAEARDICQPLKGGLTGH